MARLHFLPPQVSLLTSYISPFNRMINTNEKLGAYGVWANETLLSSS